MAVEATELLGQTSDGKQIRLAQCAADSLLLREIGRLRELTFRQVGEGTGRRRDLDAFDPNYQHIVVREHGAMRNEIGRASCRGRVGQDVKISVVAVSLKQK